MEIAEIDTDDMRIENLRVKITSARNTYNSTPLNEQIIEMGYTSIKVLHKKDRDHDFQGNFVLGLTDSSTSKAIKEVKKNLTSDVIDITVEIRFARQTFGTTDDGFIIMLHNFTYDCKTDTVSALFTLERDGGTTWEPAPDFRISKEDFWSAGFVSIMAEEIDRIGNALDFPTEVTSRNLKYSAYRIV